MIKAMFDKLKILNKIRSIRYKLILNYSILIGSLLLFVGSINLLITTDILKKNVSYYAEQTISETNKKIDVALKQIEFTSRVIINNQSLQKVLIANKNENQNIDSWENYNTRENINSILDDISAALPDIYSIGIYLDQKHVYYFGRIADKSIYDMKPVETRLKDLKNGDSEVLWIPTFNAGSNIRMFSLAREIVDPETFDTIGTLVLNINYTYLNSILNEGQSENSGVFYLTDQNGTIISCKSDNEIGKKIGVSQIEYITTKDAGTIYNVKVNNSSMLVTYSTSTYTQWKIVGMFPLKQLNSTVFKKQAIIIIIGFIGLAISFILAIVIASSITKPIKNLSKVMKTVENGQMDVAINDNSFIETRELGQSFQSMIIKIKKLLERVYEEESWKREAEFKALQAQFNPHFLYNTLETINYMLIIEEKYEISRLVTSLGDILRYSIRKDDYVLPLKNDLEQIKNYLFIQKTRFGDRLEYELSITEETLDCRILKLLIQPIVENAIVHGIERKRGKGLLIISSSLNGNYLVIKVEDNGVGMNPEQIENALNNEHIPTIAEKHTRLGLIGVSQRIKLYYGDQYGVNIESQQGQGTSVSILLPIVREELQ